MARYQIRLAYDGTDYSGFQRQKGVRTVQAVVEKALERIGWQGSSIYAAGRTDAGVHASGQVISFDFAWKHGPESLLLAFNANLPLDVSGWRIREVSADFHPRYDALMRTYVYRIFSEPYRNPLRERFSWRVYPSMKLELLREAASQYAGVHDFRAFGKPPKEGGVTLRQVFRSELLEASNNELRFVVSANAYLYHMVRRMVYLLVLVGRGSQDVGAIRKLLLYPGSDLIQGLAPPQGLSLAEVRYPGDPPASI